MAQEPRNEAQDKAGSGARPAAGQPGAQGARAAGAKQAA